MPESGTASEVRLITEKKWTKVQQQAGPLVKIVKYQRPNRLVSDMPGVRRDKNEIIRAIRDSCFRRTPTDKLELMLALMGWHCTVYVLTFYEETLPKDFAGVRSAWTSFRSAMKRLHGGVFDYVYVIEGLHGGKRYHIHLVLRDEDFTVEEVRRCWPGGIVLDPEPLMQWDGDTFLRTARYFTKERRDGDRLPERKRLWAASLSLYRKLEPPVKSVCSSGDIPVPQGAKVHSCTRRANPFGRFHYTTYIMPDTIE